MILRCLFTLSVLLVLAFGKPQHSSVKIVVGEGDIEFRAVPKKDMVINFGKGVPTPWSLVVTDAKGIELDRSKFEEKDFDPKINGFKTSLKNKSPNAQFKYRFVVFVCDSKIENCYREVHQATHKLK
jgi:hypothetical protein